MGLKGMIRMIVVGIRVRRSLPVLLTAFTSLLKDYYNYDDNNNNNIDNNKIKNND